MSLAKMLCRNFLVVLVLCVGTLRAQLDTNAECGYKPADIVFVLDESGSIHIDDFHKQINFVRSLTKLFDVSPNVTHFGALTFADRPQPRFFLGKVTSEAELNSALGNIKQARGQTYTFDALSLARMEMFAPEYSRSWVPHICILITDGNSDYPDRTAEQAKLLREQGVTVFAIGVGHDLNEAELRSVASLPEEEHVFLVDDYKALSSILEALAIKTCQVTTIPPPTTMKTDACNTPVDLQFSLPDQAGIDDTDTSLIFLYSVVNETDLSRDRVQVGLTPRMCEQEGHPILLRDHDTLEGLQLNLDYRRLAATDTASHIRFMHGQGASEASGGRDFARQVGLLVVDNESFDVVDTVLEAETAKLDMTLIVIGVGEHVNEDELRAVASGPKSYFHVDSYEDLMALTDQIAPLICTDKPAC